MAAVSHSPVACRVESVSFPTYLPQAPDLYPMFLEKRVYQGSSGAVYPLPVIDRISETPVSHAWQAIILENEFLEVVILPEIGGRIHRLFDKTNGCDVIYYQPVIKPALVGLAGPWISGGIEFNWPQHHRPSTFMPVQFEIQNHEDGAVTVWLSEHEPMARMKGMHGVRLRPGSSAMEVLGQVYNRTADIQTFHWWANVAVEVHEQYESFFPPDVTFVADHAKRAMSTFPLCSGHYYGVNYARRAIEGVPPEELPSRYLPKGSYPPNDLTWYANIPVPTSYMCMGSGQSFFGGYDHQLQAGIVHVANPHIAPGKKQWTWGNHDFGYAWDRLLTDPDEYGICRPYIELMAGVYTDNQPDFSFLQPGETKMWKQCWYPLRAIGPADHANSLAAVHFRKKSDSLVVGIVATEEIPARIEISHKGKILHRFTHLLSPAAPFHRKIFKTSSIQAFAELRLIVTRVNGEEIIACTPPRLKPLPSPEEIASLSATEPPLPSEVGTSDELYFIGLHLEQYRHATRCPSAYWQEGLRRDSGDARCNLALGRWYLRRGEFSAAVNCLRRSIERQTSLNPNPADGEAHYQLGRTYRFLGRNDEAYSAFYKATWNQAWAGASYLALAEIDATRHEWHTALDHLDRSLRSNTDNLKSRALRVEILRKMGLPHTDFLRLSLALDPLDIWLRHLSGKHCWDHHGQCLDLAFDLARCGLHDSALTLLARAANSTAPEGQRPMIHYTRAWILEQMNASLDATLARREAMEASPDYCFPSRLEEIAVLESALAANPADARAHYYLGLLLYSRRRHAAAITHWQYATEHEPNNAIAWRCLGIGFFNVLQRPRKARTAFAKARRLTPKNPRLLFESDQLAMRLGRSPKQRLRVLEKELNLVDQRDDLTVEYCGLLNQCGFPKKAEAILATRNFQPWEGGEGQALRQYTRTHLLLGQSALRNLNAPEALAHVEKALNPPRNLGEARHLLANQSDIYFWLGEIYAALGKRRGALQSWKISANFRGDFQNMSVCAFSDKSYYSARALQRMGKKAEADKLLRDLLVYARNLQKQPAKIDYFATSLPTMLLFHEDLQTQQEVTARFLAAQAWVGLQEPGKAIKNLEEILRLAPHHHDAADLMAMLETSHETVTN